MKIQIKIYIRTVKVIKRVESDTCIFTIHDNGVGQMHFKDGIVLDVAEQLKNLDCIIKITEKHPTPFVVTAGDDVIVTREARENGIKIEHLSPMCASAIVVQNLAYRLIAEFYIKVQKPKNPYSIFTDKEKAFEWCKKHVKK